MGLIHASLEIKGLGKQKLAALMDRAKRMGMTPQRYLKHLVEEDLAVSARAKSTTFKQLLGPGEAVDEAELDSLVEDARQRHHRGQPRKT